MSESNSPSPQSPNTTPESAGAGAQASTLHASAPGNAAEDRAAAADIHAPLRAPADRVRASGLAKVWLGVAAVGVLTIAVGWWLNAQLYSTRAEIAKRLQHADTTSIEARAIAGQSADATRELNARVAVLEAREQDLAAQRQALQQLYQDFAKSRDDAFLGQTADLIALGQQQAELTGSLSPLVSTLQSSAARLKRADSQRAQMVLRAVQVDLSRLKSSVVPDIPAAAQRLDELAALIDQLQPLSSAAPLEGRSGRQPAVGPTTPAESGWRGWLGSWARSAWDQVRSLVSITRVENPDVLLMSPRQTDYLRENIKLRVLNARLDLLSRNAPGYRTDMQAIQDALHRYFDTRQPRTQMALTLARQAAQVDLSAQPAANLQSLAALASLGLGSN